MTFLSRLVLARRSLEVLRDIGDVTQMHRTMMRAFPQVETETPRAALGVLFRTEIGASGLRVLLQSQAEPDWSLLPDGYLIDRETKSIDAALTALEAERVLRFLLVANPTRKIAAPRDGETEPPPNSRRVELRSDDARHEWLGRHAARSGFFLHGSGPYDGVRIHPVAAPPSVRPHRASGVTVRAVRFEGRLVVSDAQRLRDAIIKGIGPAKAYGCGLLSVAPG